MFDQPCRSWCSDWLLGGRSGDRIPVGGRDFPHLSGPALGPAQPLLQLLPTLFSGVKVDGAYLDQPSTSNALFKEGVELCLYSPLCTFVTCYRVISTFLRQICRLHLKCDDTSAETRFRLSAKRTSPFKSTWWVS